MMSRQALLALGVSLARLAVGLEPPSAPGKVTPFAPIRFRGTLGPPPAKADAQPLSMNKELQREYGAQRAAVKLASAAISHCRAVLWRALNRGAVYFLPMQ
jgi:hypothetical protein